MQPPARMHGRIRQELAPAVTATAKGWRQRILLKSSSMMTVRALVLLCIVTAVIGFTLGLFLGDLMFGR